MTLKSTESIKIVSHKIALHQLLGMPLITAIAVLFVENKYLLTWLQETKHI